MTTRYTVHGTVALITLSNPPVNGLGHATRLSLTDQLQQANADSAIKSIVIVSTKFHVSGMRTWQSPPIECARCSQEIASSRYN